MKHPIHGKILLVNGDGHEMELRDIPHIMAGSLGTDSDVSVYFLFPKLQITAKKFTRLTNKQLT